MENNQQYQNQGGNIPPQGNMNPMMQQPLPNSTAVLVLGILSIVFCWCYGIVGLTLGIIALSMSGKATRLYQENSQYYSQGSFNNLKGGKVCAIIGTILSALYLVFIIIYVLILGAALTSLPWENFR